MTNQTVTLPREVLEQLVEALNEVDQHVDLKRYDTAPNEVLFDVVMAALTAGRAALANAERGEQLLRENIMLGCDRESLRTKVVELSKNAEPTDLKEIARKSGAAIFDKCGSYGSYQAGSVLFTPAEWAHFAELMQKGSVKFNVKS